MQGNLLNYGVATRRGWARAGRSILIVIGTATLCAWIASVVWNKIYFADMESVRADLGALPGARIVSIDGYDDNPFFWKLIYATVSVDGSPGRTIRFVQPHRGELSSGSHMRVSAIGKYEIEVTTDVGSICLDLGGDSDLGRSLPLKFRDVKDMAARYDQLLAFVRQQPSGTFVDSAGRIRKYHIWVRGG